jgi:predicted nucleic acid-binding protein
MKIADTSFLVSLYCPSDENNARALGILRENKDEAIMICDTILFETLSVLNYKEGIGKASEAYNDFVGNEKIRMRHLNEKEKNDVILEFFFHSGNLSVADASIVYLAKKTKSQVLAFDRKIIQATKIRGP